MQTLILQLFSNKLVLRLLAILVATVDHEIGVVGIVGFLLGLLEVAVGLWSVLL